MNLVIRPGGTVRCVYAEAIPLAALGAAAIRRASHVEPDPNGHWTADLSCVSGPRLGPFPSRSEALQAEQRWLEDHWLEDHWLEPPQVEADGREELGPQSHGPHAHGPAPAG